MSLISKTKSALAPHRPVDAAASKLVRTSATIAASLGAALVALGAVSLHTFPTQRTASLVMMGVGVGLSMVAQLVLGGHHSVIAKELASISKVDPTLGAAGNWVEQRLSTVEATLASHAGGLAAVSGLVGRIESLGSKVDTLDAKVTQSASVREDAAGAAQEALQSILTQLRPAGTNPAAAPVSGPSGAPLVTPPPAGA